MCKSCGKSFQIQLNLVNSKSSGLDILLGIISCSNNREVDKKYKTPKNYYYQCCFFLSNIGFGHVKETPQGQVESLYLHVLGQVQMYKVNSIQYFIF